MTKLLLEKTKESIMSVLPISLLIVVLNFIVFFVTKEFLFSKWIFIGFLIGSVMLIVGMALFTLGADLSMMSVGVGVGKYITQNRKIWLLILVPFVIGSLVTIAEPDLLVLSKQVQMEGVPSIVLILMVAVGVGIFLTVALLRVVLKVDIRVVLIVAYLIVFILASFAPTSFVPLAFDSGGVTTGPMTVPFIMAIGLGVASLNGDKNNENDSFGYIALCSVGPIIAVTILGLFTNITVDNSSSSYVMNSFHDFSSYFGKTFVSMIKEIAIALSPILLFVIVFECFLQHDKKKNIIKIFIGLGYTYVGLVLFLTGANMGFMPVGSVLGRTIASQTFKWVLIPLSMLMGFFVVMAEPAVHVLNNQVEEVTGGTISKRVMLFSLAIGVAISLGLAMTRVLCDFSIWWILIPGYSIAIILSLIVPKIFTSIAFDSGGVASGPMTATFLLPLATGACHEIYSQDIKILSNGFGIVALVAMTPLIVVQLVGLIYKIKLQRAEATKELPYEDVIEFDLNGLNEVDYE